MPDNGFSRRKFLRNVTAGSAGAAVAALPAVRPAVADGAAPEAPFPLTVESFPLAEPGRAPSLGRISIVTQDGIPEAYQERLRAISSALDLQQCGSPEGFRREVSGAHIIYGGFSREDFAAARQLKWIQYTAAGVEHILWPELVESPVVLTNMQRIYSPTISETAIGLLLTLTRGLDRYALQTRERRWKPVEGLSEISGLTMGIVGMGGIGTDTAFRAHYGFGMKILAVDPKPLPKPAFVAELHSLDWLPKMPPQVDVLLCAAPHTKVSE
jgi:phosphoglycerate dehydrogenase-like enzyme